MRQSLQSRIEDLEQQTRGDNRLTVVRVIVSPVGASVPEPSAYEQRAGSWRLDRQPGESQEAFRARAVELVPRNASGFASMLEVV